MSSVYKINKGVNKPIEFKGFKAQYIWYLGIGIIVLLVLFALLYIAGVHTYICLVLVIALGAVLYFKISRLSQKYGEYGMMKKMAGQSVPPVIKAYTRKMFYINPTAGDKKP